MENNMTLKKKSVIGLLVGIILGCILFYAGVLNTTKFIVAIVSLRFMFKNPINGMILYVLAIPIVSDVTTVILAILVIGVYIMHYIWRGSFKLHHTPANIPILLFALCVVMGTVFSITLTGSIRDFVVNILSIAILIMFVNYPHDEDDVVLISKSFVFAVVLMCFYGLYQYKTGVAMGSGWVDPSQNPNIKTRIFATFENPNIFAEYLIMIMPLAISLVFRKKEGLFNKLAYCGCVMLILLNILLTYSRGGWLGMAFSMVVLVTLVDIRKLILFVPAGFVGLLLMPNSILQRILTIGSLQDSSNFYRYKVWTLAINILKDYWYSGIGIGYKAFRQISPMYIKTMAPYHTHNTYLQIGIELGVFGLLVFLVIVFALIKMSIKTVLTIDHEDRLNRFVYGSYIAGLSAVLVHGVAEHVLYNPKIILVFWVFIAVNIRMYLIRREIAK